MAKFWSPLTPVHVNGYERIRFNNLEWVEEHFRAPWGSKRQK